MAIHLIPTPEAFADLIRQAYGPEAVLHPNNRLTACGRRMNRMTMALTENPSRATCKTCARKAGA